jgi:hypothetical protein
MLIPSIYIAISTGLAGLAWLFYSKSQSGRRQAGVLSWLSLPFFGLSLIYFWFTFVDVDIDIRVVHARYGIMSIALTQAIILFVVSYLYGGKDGK